MIVEKPFGKDLESSRQLDVDLKEVRHFTKARKSSQRLHLNETCTCDCKSQLSVRLCHFVQRDTFSALARHTAKQSAFHHSEVARLGPLHLDTLYSASSTKQQSASTSDASFQIH